MIGQPETLFGWPLAALLAVAVVAAAAAVRAYRRRAALDEALHELRRPLQAIALAPAAGRGPARGAASPVQLAAAALERLEHEINGGSPRIGADELPGRPLLEAAVARWGVRARLGGGALGLSWRAGEATIRGDGVGLAQALDNLIVNAIEHGGPSISVEAEVRERQLIISVADSGATAAAASGSEIPADALTLLAGRRRRGHGLAIVRRVAAAHGGRFALSLGERGSRAVLELPLVARSSNLRPVA